MSNPPFLCDVAHFYFALNVFFLSHFPPRMNVSLFLRSSSFPLLPALYNSRGRIRAIQNLVTHFTAIFLFLSRFLAGPLQGLHDCVHTLLVARPGVEIRTHRNTAADIESLRPPFLLVASSSSLLCFFFLLPPSSSVLTPSSISNYNHISAI